MQFQITILKIERKEKPTAKGSYTELEIAYKNITQGKVESKKIMSFVKPDAAYKALVDAAEGSTWTITSEKGAPNKEGKSFWQWNDATSAVAGAPVATSTSAGPTTNSTPVRSSYATSEERAATQVYIVKQSSISNAIAALSVAATAVPAADDILELAQKFVDFVFSKEAVSKPVSLDDVDSDVPF